MITYLLPVILVLPVVIWSAVNAARSWAEWYYWCDRRRRDPDVPWLNDYGPLGGLVIKYVDKALEKRIPLVLRWLSITSH